jgi:predicted DNA-binding protein (UPF0251 family)
MKKIHVEGYKYQSVFGEVIVDVDLMLSDDNCNKFEAGQPLSELETSITLDQVQMAERKALIGFFSSHYRRSMEDATFELSPDEVQALINFLKVNKTEAARVLGIDKGTLSRHISGERTMSRSTAVLLLERVGQELGRPGAVRAMIDKGPIPVLEIEASEIVDKQRYGTAT